MRRYIYEGLSAYLEKDRKPWHMPGHKRNGLGARDIESGEDRPVDVVLDALHMVDVTELAETDDLHHPAGMIRDSLNELARVYETDASFYLVNGSTGGILAGIAACAQAAGKTKILVAQNCHRSVFHAAELLKLQVISVSPGLMSGKNPTVAKGITQDVAACALAELSEEERGAVACFVITSPTYEGAFSDIPGILKETKKYGIPLFVDEAHGAHLPFLDKQFLLNSAVTQGADMVVQSLHKTMPALTQTAILHVNNSGLTEAVKKELAVFMSSSPSYPLMLSAERAVAWADENREAFTAHLRRVCLFRGLCRNLKYVKLLRPLQEKDGTTCFLDPTRVVVYAKLPKGSARKCLYGSEIARYLTVDAGIEAEMAGLDYVVFISTVMDTAEDLADLYIALEHLDMAIKEGFAGDSEGLPEEVSQRLDAMVGQKVNENIYAYPPGVPIVNAGKKMTKRAAEIIKEYLTAGITLYGLP